MDSTGRKTPHLTAMAGDNEMKSHTSIAANLSIISPGDTPAKVVIEKLDQSRRDRLLGGTKEELNEVMQRVEDIYDHFEVTTAMDEAMNAANMEYFNDIADLEIILKDQIKKKKYQQQVNVFIVGFEDVSGQKLKLLQQVNEFFMSNCKNIESEDWFPSTPDIDLDDVSTKIEESLSAAAAMVDRLGELNKQMTDYWVNYALNKASNKGKKKLEKALQQARDDMSGLNEKLLAVQAEVDDKEDKIQQLFKQIEIKNMEIQRYKTAAEIAKKNMQDNESLKNELSKTDDVIQEQKQRIGRLEMELAQLQHSREQSQNRLLTASQETEKKVEELQALLDEKSLQYEEMKRDMERAHDMQVLSMQDAHESETDLLRQQHEAEIKTLTDELEQLRQQLEELEKQQLENAELLLQQQQQLQQQPAPAPLDLDDSKSETSKISRKSSKLSSRPSTQKSKPSSKSLVSVKSAKSVKSIDEREYAEIAVQDEGGDPNAAVVGDRISVSAHSRPKSHLMRTREEVFAQFDNVYDLNDEESWSSIPEEDLEGRFLQYRTVSQRRVMELEGQVKVTVAKTQRKIETLKGQFIEHKGKWETERRVFVDQINQSINLQNEAELEADTVMSQLEMFINDQERLDQDDDIQRQQQLSRTTTLSAEEAQAELQHRDQIFSTDTIQPTTPQTEQQMTDMSPAIAQHPTPEPQHVDEKRKPGGDDYATLVKQTDDAKAQELERSNTTMSAPPTIFAPDQKKSFAPQPSATDTDMPPNDKCQQTDFSRPETKSIGQASGHSSILKSKSSMDDDNDAEKPSSAGVSATSITSRTSLRSQYRNSLVEARSAASERRSKSAMVALPSHDSLADDQLIDIDDDLDDLALIEDGFAGIRSATSDVGTSPPPALEPEKTPTPPRTPMPETEPLTTTSSTTTLTPVQSYEEVIEVQRAPSKYSVGTQMVVKTPSPILMEKVHIPTADTGVQVDILQDVKAPEVWKDALVQEYLNAYEGIVAFKQTLSKLMLDKDLMTASQLLTEMDTLTFSKNMKMQPQIESMTRNVYHVLNEITGLLNSVIYNDREAVVSSLMNISREPTFVSITKERSESGTSRAGRSTPSDESAALKELRDQYNKLQTRMEEESKKHEAQQKHNSAVIREMQDTINMLRQELSTLHKAAQQQKEHEEALAQESAVMFTRLDSDRNSKTMKKAVFESKLDPEKYKEAVAYMDDYVNMPAQRLGQLVRKYVHHRRMKEVEENIRKSSSLNESVFEVLDKMEALQSERARKWAVNMDNMSEERLRLAGLLTETLDDIEQESGIFLIKPHYSYRGRNLKDKYLGKLSRSGKRYPSPAPKREMRSAGGIAAPTPASLYRQIPTQVASEMYSSPLSRDSRRDPSRERVMLAGSHIAWGRPAPKPVWSVTLSHSGSDAESVKRRQFYSSPRILELDVNRMLIGQNAISSPVQLSLSDDRLLNMSQNNLRSYITVSRPTAHLGQSPVDQTPMLDLVLPMTPQDLPHVMPQTPHILPPISRYRQFSSGSQKDINDLPLPPHSPPGSSLRHSPPNATPLNQYA